MANIRRDASREGWELFEQYAGMKVFYTFDGIRCIIGVIIYQIFYFFQGEPEKGKIDFIHTMDKQYDLRILENLALGNDGFVSKMVSLFLKQTPDLMSQIQMAVQLMDVAMVSRVAHKMKSSIDTFCIMEIADEIRMLERASDAEWTSVEIEKAVEKILRILTSVIEKLQIEFQPR
ncbi:MAG TPA: Hpt domain-containing protein [Catalimonadaceae bacterium]|nr:Hpt domain-containing protein [Catalimonadaceae bacterium]